MNVVVYGRNLAVTPALQDYVQKKLRRLDRLVTKETSAQATLGVERGTHIAEVMIPLNGLFLRGEEATDNMYASIDLVVDKLEKQLNKYKTRFSRRRLGMATGAVAEAEPVPEEGESDEIDHVVKVKKFTLKPQCVSEAVMQMNMLGHDFYVFTNADTEHVNVVYRRKDGDYGLLEPEV